MKARFRLLAALAAAATAAPALAQVPVTPRALGMGGAYIGVARGSESLWENPANLALSGNARWSFAFPQLAVGGTILGLDTDELKDLKDYDEVAPARAQEILAAIPDGTDAQVELRVPLVAISVGHTAVGVAYAFQGNHTVGHDIVDLFLNGYQNGRTNYQVGNTAGQRTSFVDLAAAHGRSFGPVALGVTGHYYIGRAVAASRLSNPTYCAVATNGPVTNVCAPATATPPQDVNVTYESVRSTGGHGYGVDVGAAMHPIPGLTVGASVENVLGSMTWNDDLRARRIVLNRNDFENGDLDGISDRYDASETDYNEASASALQKGLRSTLFDDTDFARVIKLGGAFAAPTGTTIGAEYRNRTDDSRLQGLWKQGFSVGVSQNLKVLTLSVGAAKDDADGSLLSAGLALGPLKLGIGRLNNGSTNNVDRKGWVATFGLSAHGAMVP